jgi:WhiB family redox-sensing transcriptional regulator
MSTPGPAGRDWRHYSVCRDGVDPELFFPVGTSGVALLQVEQAKAVCWDCPVADECLRWALDAGIDDGVWDGMSEQERRAFKRWGGPRTKHKPDVVARSAPGTRQ